VDVVVGFSQIPGLTPHAHQILLMWKSLSGALLIGAENVQAVKQIKKEIVEIAMSFFLLPYILLIALKTNLIRRH
jgi:hypothetical protein